MTSNLNLTLAAGTAVTASKNDGATFSFTPTSCAANGNCPLNGNTFSFDGSWLYNWYAATAGVGTSSSSGDVDGSICPKGWRLPGNNGTAYRKLLTDAYGIAASGETTTSIISKIQSAPLSFTYGLSGGGEGWKTADQAAYLMAARHAAMWYTGNSDGIVLYSAAGSDGLGGGRVRCVAN